MAAGPERREARRFEPPPWERDRFEELAGRDREQERTAQDLPAAEEAPPTGEREDAASPERRAEPAPVGEKPPSAELDAMLLALKAEEPEALEGAWKVGLAAAVFMATLGLMLVVWGAVALARAGGAGAAGVMGSAIMTVMGALFAALGVWLGVRSLRQRGVL